jgi:hypothetical protein
VARQQPRTNTERVLAARVAAYTKHSKYDPAQSTSKARSAFLARFLADVDPDNHLPEIERTRRAEAALKAHMTRLSLRAAKARRLRGGDGVP